jgi:hypothetical protein
MMEMTNLQQIQDLLEKFWNAETSATEEAVLTQYFAGENVDPSLSYAKSYFKKSQGNTDIASTIVAKLVEKYFNAETSVEEDGLIKEYFDQDNISAELSKYKMLFKVMNKAQAVSYQKELSLDLSKNTASKNSTTERTAKVIKFNWWKTAAAASVIAVGGYFVTNNLVKESISAEQTLVMNKSNLIEPQNAEEAYEITLEALALVSNKYKKGQGKILEGMTDFHNAADLTN